MDTFTHSDAGIVRLVNAGLAKMAAKEEKERQELAASRARNLALWAERTEEIRAALPEELQPYMEASGGEDDPPRERYRGGSAMVWIPGLSPIRISMFYSFNDQCWTVGFAGSWTYHIPRINYWDGYPRWYWSEVELTNDLEVALVTALKAKKEFDDQWERYNRNHQPAATQQETEYIPVADDRQSDVISDLVQLIRDVAREEINNSNPG